MKRLTNVVVRFCRTEPSLQESLNVAGLSDSPHLPRVTVKLLGPVITRPLEAGDREAVARILDNVGNFSAQEQTVALELIDAWISTRERSDYLCWVIEDAIGVQGYVCIGPTPLTDGTFDLYWIAVDPSSQGRGYGQRLTRLAEREARARGGRLLLIETASHDAYATTILFYKRAGYSLVSTILDFYKAGDDKLTFAKRLDRGK